MGFNMGAAANVLKVRYIGTVREQLNNEILLFKQLNKQIQMVSGKDFTVPLHTSRNVAAAIARGDGDILPTAGQQGYTTTLVPNKYLYSRIMITGPTIAATRDNAGAFVEAIQSEVDGVTRDMKRAINRMLHGDGTDALAYWTGAANATPAPLDDGQGNNFVYVSGTDELDLIQGVSPFAKRTTPVGAKVGVDFTVSRTAGGTYQAAWSAGTVAGSADGDFLVKAGTLGLAMMGIRGIISNTNPPLGPLQGIDALPNEYWQAQVFGNGGVLRQLAFEDMQEVIDAVATNSDYTENDIKLILCSHGMRRAYYKLCVAERRHVNTMKLDGGFSALDFNGLGLVADSQCRKNVMYYVTPDTMSIFRTSDFDWADLDGSYLSRVANTDAYEGYLFHYGNLACLSRNGNGLLADLIEA
jgi:hypothetical protein